MNRVASFEKVSFEQFSAALEDCGIDPCKAKEIYDGVQLPKRATSGSAGYDFKSPIDFCLRPGETIKIPTGIRVYMEDGWWLGCFPRSGLGFKYRMQLNNTVGVIDSDYYGSSNEGHIFAKVTNDSNEGRSLTVKAGDAFMQGILIPYGITYSDDVQDVREGGMGSTDRK